MDGCDALPDAKASRGPAKGGAAERYAADQKRLLGKGMANPFSARFDGLDTLADIRRLTIVHPDPVTGLEELSPALAAERL
ncbi:Transposition protein, TnsC-related protein [Pseudomonas savastanoi pv. phaseolicola]|nr:Transposition protein, TnsC-related protein [Pseudomonas savastanoi pv. phaseolicola]